MIELLICVLQRASRRVLSPSPALPANEGFNRDQMLFFIDLMCQHLEAVADGLPKTLKELKSWQKKSVRSNKRNMVAGKWNALIDTYKNKKRTSTKPQEKETICFHFIFFFETWMTFYEGSMMMSSLWLARQLGFI